MDIKRYVSEVRLAVVVGSLLVAGYVQAEQATGTDGTYYQVEGEANCNSFSSNDVGTFTVLDPVGEGAASDGLLNVTYSIDSTDGQPVVAWQSEPESEVVNAVILVGEKISGKQKSMVYHFGVNGAAMDSGEIGPGEGLAKLRFCYGLASLATPPAPAPELLAVCRDLDSGEELLDFTGVQCPTPSPDPEDNSDKRFIFSVNPYGQNGAIAVCTCNFDEALSVCDPALEAGQEGACLPFPDQLEGEPPKGLTWVPAEIVIFQNGTGFCWTTLSGSRQCAR